MAFLRGLSLTMFAGFTYLILASLAAKYVLPFIPWQFGYWIGISAILMLLAPISRRMFAFLTTGGVLAALVGIAKAMAPIAVRFNLHLMLFGWLISLALLFISFAEGMRHDDESC